MLLHQQKIYLAIVCALMFASTATAQRVRFGSPSNSAPMPVTSASGGSTPTMLPNSGMTTNSGVGQAPGLLTSSTTQLQPVITQSPLQGSVQGNNIQPPASGWISQGAAGTNAYPTNYPQAGGYPAASLQQPMFDAYATQSGTTQPPVYASPGGNFNGYGAGTGNEIYPPANSQPFYVPNQSLPGYPNYTGAPNSMFPGWNPSGISWPYAAGAGGQTMRLFEDAHFKYTWIRGDNGADVDINDVQLGVTANYPDFLASGQPLKISPIFIFHFWNGPSDPLSGADLPSKAYSALLNFNWSTRQDVQFGGEVDFAVGVYSDFQSVTSDAIRLTGTGLGWLRVTPNLTLKAGVEYFDRLDVKILPAGGIFWKPNPDLILELYFPRPRIARRLPQVGNTEVWLYAGGEYGGGSWVVERANKMGGQPSDQVDINDIRVFGGVEWTTMETISGFFEAGYVFERNLVYRNYPADNLGLSDSFMLRTGIAW